MDHAPPPPPVTPRRRRPLRVEVSVRTMVLAAIVIGSAWVLLRLAPVVLVLVVALVLVGTLNPAVEWLERHKVKRSLGIAFVFTTLLLVLLGLLAVTIPALIDQVTALVSQAPALRDKLVEFLARSRATAPLAESLRTIDYGAFAKGGAGVVLRYSAQSFEIVAYLASAVFLALYIMLDRDRLRGGLYALVPRRRHILLSRVLLNLERIVGGYIRGQVLTSGLMAAFAFVLLTSCHVKGALAIGVIAGVADVLPYIGTFLSVGPAIAAAAPRGPVIMAVVLGAMLVYEEFESRFLVPKIYGDALKLPSSVVLLALLAGGTLLGIPGALLALPVAAAIRMLIEELRVELPGEYSDSSLRDGDLQAEREYEQRAHRLAAGEAAAIAIEITANRTDTSPEKLLAVAKSAGSEDPS